MDLHQDGLRHVLVVVNLEQCQNVRYQTRGRRQYRNTWRSPPLETKAGVAQPTRPSLEPTLKISLSNMLLAIFTLSVASCRMAVTKTAYTPGSYTARMMSVC